MEARHKVLMKATHILQTDFGVKCTLELDDEGPSYQVRWDGVRMKSWPEDIDEKIRNTFRPWRDAILQGFAKRTGRKILVVES